MEIKNLRNLIHLEPNEIIDDELICQICLEFVLKPLECEDCERLFCSDCLQSLFQKRSICPYNCKSSPMKTKKPHRYVRNKLDSIKYKCQFHTQGCTKILTQDSLEKHIKECEFQTVQCKNNGCQFIGGQNQLEYHLKDCQYQILNYTDTGKDDCIKELNKRISELEISYKILKDSDQQKLEKIEKLEKENKNYATQFDTLVQKISHLETIVQQLQQGSKQSQNLQSFQIDMICPKNQRHELKWMRPWRGSCFQCKALQSYLRYSCVQCQIGFCQKCRLPQCNFKSCPIGHVLQQLIQLPGYTCDFCSKSLDAETSFQDRECDFDICMECYQNFKKK